MLNFVTGAIVNIELGRAFVQSGDFKDARHYYEAAFARWKHADEDLPIVQQSRSEYSRIP